MPKETEHKSCVRCGEKARVCAYTGYYFLTRKSKATPPRKIAKTQIKGTLPSRGFCPECFLRYARSQGWGEEVLLEVRQKMLSTKKEA
jgi:hypothetical protein